MEGWVVGHQFLVPVLQTPPFRITCFRHGLLAALPDKCPSLARNEVVGDILIQVYLPPHCSKSRVPAVYPTSAHSLFLAFFAFNEINNLTYVLSVRLRIPTPPVSTCHCGVSAASQRNNRLYDQETLHIGFNGQYLLEFLRAVGGMTLIRMQVRDAESTAEFRPSGDDGEECRHVLMPLRL